MKKADTYIDANNKDDLVKFLKETSYFYEGETYVVKDLEVVEEIDW